MVSPSRSGEKRVGGPSYGFCFFPCRRMYLRVNFNVSGDSRLTSYPILHPQPHLEQSPKHRTLNRAITRTTGLRKTVLRRERVVFPSRQSEQGQPIIGYILRSTYVYVCTTYFGPKHRYLTKNQQSRQKNSAIEAS